MKPFAYFKFWLKSSNEHGVHSPFVFNWITQGVYLKNPSWKARSRKEVFVERVIAYFKPEQVVWLSLSPVSDILMRQTMFFLNTDSLTTLSKGVQMIYIDGTQSVDSETVIETLLSLGNDGFVLVDKRADKSETKVLWEALLVSDKTTVTMDFYYFGMAFVRREQFKQHFAVRL